MLEAYCKLLRGLSSADEGVESVLSAEAYEGFIELTAAVYGAHAERVVRAQFLKRPDGSYVCVMEDADRPFRYCLTGKG